MSILFYVEFLIFLNNSLQESITRLSSFQGIRPILSVNEVDLKRNLLDPAVFDKTVRPRINTSHTVNVQIGVTSVFVTDLVSTLPKLWFKKNVVDFFTTAHMYI